MYRSHGSVQWPTNWHRYFIDLSNGLQNKSPEHVTHDFLQDHRCFVYDECNIHYLLSEVYQNWFHVTRLGRKKTFKQFASWPSLVFQTDVHKEYWQEIWMITWYEDSLWTLAGMLFPDILWLLWREWMYTTFGEFVLGEDWFIYYLKVK